MGNQKDFQSVAILKDILLTLNKFLHMLIPNFFFLNIYFHLKSTNLNQSLQNSMLLLTCTVVTIP